MFSCVTRDAEQSIGHVLARAGAFSVWSLQGEAGVMGTSRKAFAALMWVLSFRLLSKKGHPYGHLKNDAQQLQRRHLAASPRPIRHSAVRA